MYNIARKNTLGIHLRRFKKEFPRKGDYDFFPATWLYPTDFYDINEYYQQKVGTSRDSGIGTSQKKQILATPGKEPLVLFICKPEASSQGRGIFIFRKVDEMRQTLNRELQAQHKQFNEYIQAQQQYDTACYYSYTT